MGQNSPSAFHSTAGSILKEKSKRWGGEALLFKTASAARHPPEVKAAGAYPYN
jgi:hypothetical protein